MQKQAIKSPGSLLVVNLIIALAYFLLAKLSHLLAIPPGYATSVWPAAGLALAGTLLFGYRILPAVFIATFFADASVATHWFSHTFTTAGIFLSVALACATTLQAWLGRLLLEGCIKANGFNLREGNVFKLIVRGGLVSPLAGSILGTKALYLTGSISGSNILISWFTWYIGDSIGIVTLVPIILILATSELGKTVWQKTARCTPFAIAFAVTTLTFIFVIKVTSQEHRQRHLQTAAKTINAIEKSLFEKQQVVMMYDAFYQSSSFVDREEYHQFSEALIRRHPQLKVSAYVPRIRENQLTLFTQQAKKDGLSDFSVKNVSGKSTDKKPYYFPVFYLESDSPMPELIGLDLTTSPERLKAMTAACQKNNLASSSPVKLLDGKFGHVLFYPYFKSNPHKKIFPKRNVCQLLTDFS